MMMMMMMLTMRTIATWPYDDDRILDMVVDVHCTTLEGGTYVVWENTKNTKHTSSSLVGLSSPFATAPRVRLLHYPSALADSLFPQVIHIFSEKRSFKFKKKKTIP